MSITLNKIIPSPLFELNHKDSDLWGRDFSFEKGKSYQITASSGSGKTSLISIIYGLRNDYCGEIRINSINCKSISQKQWIKLRQNSLSIVPQGLWIFDELSALENIQLKNRLTKHKSETAIDDLIKRAGMFDHKQKKAGILSFGQKQRISIIRALAQPFDYLLLDESFSHLDEMNKNTMWEIIKEETLKKQATTLLTSLGNESFDTDFKIKL